MTVQEIHNQRDPDSSVETSITHLVLVVGKHPLPVLQAFVQSQIAVPATSPLRRPATYRRSATPPPSRSVPPPANQGRSKTPAPCEVATRPPACTCWIYFQLAVIVFCFCILF